MYMCLSSVTILTFPCWGLPQAVPILFSFCARCMLHVTEIYIYIYNVDAVVV